MVVSGNAVVWSVVVVVVGIVVVGIVVDPIVVVRDIFSISINEAN